MYLPSFSNFLALFFLFTYQFIILDLYLMPKKEQVRKIVHYTDCCSRIETFNNLFLSIHTGLCGGSNSSAEIPKNVLWEEHRTLNTNGRGLAPPWRGESRTTLGLNCTSLEYEMLSCLGTQTHVAIE